MTRSTGPARTPVVGDLAGTFSLLREGYRFLPNRRRPGSDVFETRLLGQPATCIAGVEATRLFYDEDRFERRSAMPPRITRTLFGEGGVQGLDGVDHGHRKAMFMALMTRESIGALNERAAASWAAAAERWAGDEQVVLFDETPPVLLDAAAAWAGVPLDGDGSDGDGDGSGSDSDGALSGYDRSSLARDLMAMVDGFAAVGPRHWRARRARHRAERRMGNVIGQVREGRLAVPAGSAADVVARHRDLRGALLDERVAAVELLNVIQPIVAVTWYVTFAAHALHAHPAWRERLRDAVPDAAGVDHDAELFVQEVRRYYPFTPFLGARVRDDFEWQGYDFPARRLVLLDVYGAAHDPVLWGDPARFAPERFAVREIGSFDFIPQGGGDPHSGHRCAGERITVELTKLATSFLARAIDYDVPRQDLGFPLRRIPTHPRDGFVMTGVRTTGSWRLPAGRTAA